jgi:hypothetical protein
VTHENYHFSVTVRSDDLAVVNCLRSLAQYSQRTGNNRIPWGGTKDADWEGAGHTVTFHFTCTEYRVGFIEQCQRLLPAALWFEVQKNDNDPAKPQK